MPLASIIPLGGQANLQSASAELENRERERERERRPEKPRGQV
jgi:hypothetical protein